MKETPDNINFAANNGLLDRRFFLKAGLGVGGGLMSASALSSEGKDRFPWMKQPGMPMGQSGPSRFEEHIKREGVGSQPGTTGSGASRTPIEYLDGIITPSRLHFERHHSGIPDIDPAQHRLVIHGLVERPLSFSMESLARYEHVSNIQFLECSGNSGAMISPKPLQRKASNLHGLVSCSEWGGVPLKILLDEAGIKPEGKWIVASGSDAAMMSRSVPIEKIMDDAIIATHQNGEPLRPSNGYPMRLFLPGWEGNACVKWLRTIKVTSGPSMTKDETSKYSDLRDDGIAELFTFPMGVKSVITSPSLSLNLTGPGIYQIKGIAWSGSGKIKSVELSADGGKTWAEALLDEHVLPKALTRFRSAWKWDGTPATIMSRAIDEKGNIQPTREQWFVGRAKNTFYHFNAIQTWGVNTAGEINNVYL
ncbi:MAG: sulfane dehydrogenase subunit SoxC [Woeseiaceae bacterium]|jgi:sulfane dehydrogenase subunit SoxC|tara:strand:+ start:85091 stop:86356 length:1266 start_codon:yes stop_codon:yes gene_type:complete